MQGEQQATMPSFTSLPIPNPNPIDPDAPLYQYAHGFDGLGEQPAFELDNAAASQTGIISQIADSTTFEHASGNIGDVSQQMVKDMAVPPSQPENIQLVQCEVCNITCNSKEVYEKHAQGKKHMKNMQKIALSSVIGPKVTTTTSVGELESKKQLLLQNGASADTLLYCEACNVVCNNQDVFKTHLAGKRHQSKATIQNANTNTNTAINATSDAGPTTNPDPLRCDLCKINCTSIEVLNIHMLGKKHLKKLKESAQVPEPSVTRVPTPDPQPKTDPTEGKTVNSVENNPVSCELCGISCNTYEVLKNHLAGKKHQKNLEKSQKVIGPNPAPGTEPEVLKNEGMEEGKIVNLEKSQKVIGPNPAPGTGTDTDTELQKEGTEEGKIVNLDRGSRKTKRVGGDEDIEAKRRKVLESGGTLDALRTCTVCNVVCGSATVYIQHLAGKKHAAMAVKQAESQTGLTGQQT